MCKHLFESTSSQRMLWMLALVLIGLCAAAPMIWAQGGTGAANDHTVLILEKSVKETTLGGGAITSLEAQQATALGFTVEIASDAQWAAKSTAQFATYRAIILGDPQCETNTTPIAAAEANKTTWGPAITGNIVAVGTDPAFLHLGVSPQTAAGAQAAGAQLTSNAIAFAALPHGQTGAYIALSCYYATASSDTPVPVLDPFGSFTVEGQGGSANSSHIVAPTHPVMTGLTDARLSNWSNSTHEAFDTWPASFRVLAIQEGITSSFVAPDATTGAPYVIARGGETHTQTFSGAGPFPESKTFSFGTGTTAHSIRFTLTQAPSDGLNFDVSVTAFLVAQNDPNFNSRLNPPVLTRSRLNPQFVASLTPFVPPVSSGPFVCDTYADPTNNNCTIYNVAVTAASGTTFGPVEKLVKWNGTLQDPKLFRAETSSSDFVELVSVVYQDPGVGSSSNGFSQYTVANDTSTSGMQVQVLFSSPKPDNSSTFRKTRSTVPIKFTLAQGSTFLTGSSGFTPHIMVGLCSTSTCEGSTTVMPVASAGGANTADVARFDPIKGNWVYNLDVTPPAYVVPGTYRVTVHVDGLSPDQSVLFKLTQ